MSDAARKDPFGRNARRGGVVVLGDVMVDLVLRPAEPLRSGTDVPGQVLVRAGGSAANTARWLARIGTPTTLIGAIGRDAAGRELARSLGADGVRLRLVRISNHRTGRIGILVSPDAERTFVADRGAADRLAPDDIRRDWLAGAELLHLPAYSLLGEPLGLAGRRAIELARRAGMRVSLDLASIGPLLGRGREAAVALIEAARPDLLFATADEAAAVLGPGRGPLSGALADNGPARLLQLAPIVVVKRGAEGATVLATGHDRPLRHDVPTRPVAALESTGAGDAFDAGFIGAWLADGSAGPAPATPITGTATARRSMARRLRRATEAGHRLARRQLTQPDTELRLL